MKREAQATNSEDAEDFGLEFVKRTIATALYLAGWVFVGSIVLYLLSFYLLNN